MQEGSCASCQSDNVTWAVRAARENVIMVHTRCLLLDIKTHHLQSSEKLVCSFTLRKFKSILGFHILQTIPIVGKAWKRYFWCNIHAHWSNLLVWKGRNQSRRAFLKSRGVPFRNMRKSNLWMVKHSYMVRQIHLDSHYMVKSCASFLQHRERPHFSRQTQALRFLCLVVCHQSTGL